MKGKILLFDIDETIFNPGSFLENFYSEIVDSFNLSDKDLIKIKNIYIQIKQEYGYFSPADFLEKIIENHPEIDRYSLEKVFWNIDLFNKNVYKDASVIKDLGRIGNIGIFSKGEESFQKQKISFLSDIVEPDDIHVFRNKLEKISEILDIYQDLNIYFIDNELEVLESIRKLNPDANLILIDRKNEYENSDIIKIKDLTELKSLIYD